MKKLSTPLFKGNFKPLYQAMLFLFSLIYSSGFAQQAYFNTGNFDRDLPGKILTKSGEVKDVTITYQHPDFLKLPTSPLKTSAGQIDKGTLDAFTLDGRTWVFRQTAIGSFWVILQRQGAIEVYDYLTSDSKGKITNIITVGSVISKGNTHLLQSELLLGYKKKMGGLVSDNAELAAKVGEKGYAFIQYLNVVDEYNNWFEKNNPGKTKYLPVVMGLATPGNGQQAPSFSSIADIKAQSQANNEKKLEENKTQLDGLFAGRSSSVSTELASAKDNTPAKKETFAAKLNRIKADGNKVGVVFYLNPVRVNPKLPGNSSSSGNAMSEEFPIDGEFMDTSLQPLGEEFTKELNAALGRTDIEMIDISRIPYRDVKVLGVQTRVDDWWATKYKVVFAFTVDPRIKATHDSFGGEVKFNASINFISSLLVTEYIGNAASNKQDIITQVLNLGAFLSPAISQKEDIMDINVLYSKLIEKLGTSVYERARTERADGIKKLVEKKLKP